MLQRSRNPLTSRQQRQLWQQRRRAYQRRRAMQKQRRLQAQQTPAQIYPKQSPLLDQHRSAAQVHQALTPESLRTRLPRRSSSSRSTSARSATVAIASDSQRLRRVRGGSNPWYLCSYLARLIIIGSGVAAIAGTILTIIDPDQNNLQSHPQSSSSVALPSFAGSVFPTQVPTSTQTFSSQDNAPTSLFYRWSQESQLMRLIREGRELSEVKQEVQQLAASQTGLTPAMFFLNPDTGDYLNINGDRSVSAASTIKIPVLLAVFEDVDAGKIRLDESLVMRKDLVATEAGSMQYQPIGTRFSALETVEYMITISDNTATNMLIDRLGGAEKLNQRFRGWGLKQIMIRNPLPDLEGTNTVSPQDMAALMLKLTDKTFLSSSSREQALAILRQTVTNTLLPQGLDEDAQIAHKTGDIGSVVGDIGLIEMPNGQHYVAAILVQRPHNDPRAQELIRKISKLTYQTFRHPQQSVPTNPTVPQD